jgi:glyoxylase-like metal-dependent hydrolase (beta-lactamase superfamily II)
MSDLDLSGAEAGAPLPPPLVNGSPQEVVPGVYVIPDERVPLVPNIGVVVGERAALVVDTGIGPRNGARVREIAGELAGDRELYLTLTHFHPEHGYGAQAFGDATIVYNQAQAEELKEKGGGFLENFKAFGEVVAAELEGVEFVDPDETYDGALKEIDLGGKVVQLRTYGAAHTRGDQVVFLPEERILFAGDLVENGFFPLLPFFPPYDTDVDAAKWVAVLGELKALEPATVVPGHGELGDTGLIDIYVEYLGEIQVEAKRLAAEGKDVEEIVGALMPQLLAKYPDWDGSEPWRIATAVGSVLSK